MSEDEDWDRHVARQQARYEKYSRRYSISHMSNTRWRRVFGAIADAGVTEIQSEWKYIGSDKVVRLTYMPRREDLHDRVYTDGCSHPYEYRWIEWIRFPRKYFDELHGLTRDQDVSAVEDALKAARAHIVCDDKAVTVIAWE